MKSVNHAPPMRCKNCKHRGASPISDTVRVEFVEAHGGLGDLTIYVRAYKLCATCDAPLGVCEFPIITHPRKIHVACDSDEALPEFDFFDLQLEGSHYMAKESEGGFAKPKWKRPRSVYKIVVNYRATCDECKRKFIVNTSHTFQAKRFKPVGATE